jgi:hypothetical protein
MVGLWMGTRLSVVLHTHAGHWTVVLYENWRVTPPIFSLQLMNGPFQIHVEMGWSMAAGQVHLSDNHTEYFELMSHITGADRKISDAYEILIFRKISVPPCGMNWNLFLGSNSIIILKQKLRGCYGYPFK